MWTRSPTSNEHWRAPAWTSLRSSTTYIRTTPERLWQALTDPDFTQRYWWSATFDTDWETGSTMTWHMFGVRIDDPQQVVLESHPHRRLAYTWHSFPHEFADRLGLTEDARERIAAEPRSKVTFEIEPLGDLVKLTVIHDGFDAGSLVAPMVSEGWPRVLSGVKTLLETGEAMPRSPRRPAPLVLGGRRHMRRNRQQISGRKEQG